MKDDNKKDLKEILGWIKEGNGSTEYYGVPDAELKQALEDLGYKVITIGGFIEPPLTMINKEC